MNMIIKKIGAGFLTLLLILAIFVMLPSVSAAGPNYLGFDPGSHEVTVGDTFYTLVWANITSEIDACSIDNLSFTGGLINFTGLTQGDLFAGQTMWLVPGTDGTIDNVTGYAKPILWTHTGKANNTNATFVNISWSAYYCGEATINISDGGTALAGEEPGTTKYNGTIEVHPKAPVGLTATMVNSTVIGLNWSKQTGDDKVLVRYKAGSAPSSVTDGTFLYNDTGTTTQHTGLSEGQTVYYSAWGWNETAGYYSLTYDTDNGKSNQLPTFSSESPSDDTGDVDKTQATVSVTIADPDGDSFNWTIQGTYISNAGANDASNGSKSANTITDLPYSTDIIWYVNVTDGSDWNNVTYNFTVRDQYSPSVPSDFVAENYSTSQINLSWTLTDDRIIIENHTSANWGRGTGNELYNGTGSSYQHTGLSKNTQYYYRAWSYNETDNVYSSSNVSATNTTLDNSAPNQGSSPTPSNETNWYETRWDYYQTAFTSGGQWLNVTVTDPESDTVDVSFYWSNHTLIGTDSDVAHGNVASISVENLTVYQTYYWYANVTDAEFTTQSEIFWFKHEAHNWDINRDAECDYLDASSLTSHYGESGANGWVRDDINDDGDVDYLDASSLTSHYGDDYS